MESKVLVTYASKYGATAEIAEKIGAVLCQAGLQAEVVPVDDVRELSAYQAVILGGALYIGKWHKGAETFLKTHEKDLTARQVWVFSSGPTGEGSPIELVEGQRVPAALQPVVDRIHPRDIAVFHGHIDPDKLNVMEKFAIKNVVKKPFGDFRDWGMIINWANQIAHALKDPQPIQAASN